MQAILKEIFFPAHVKLFLQKAGVMLALLTICRAIFLLLNLDYFPQWSILDFFWGAWFDIITISLYFLPFLLLFLIPNPWRNHFWYKFVFNFYFHFVSFIFVITNLIDVEYYKFIANRSSYDLFVMISYGEDVGQLLDSFLFRFWYLILLAIVLIVSVFLWNRRLDKNSYFVRKFTRKLIFYRFITFVFYGAFFFLLSRGGFRLIPIAPINASEYTLPQNSPLILNSPFTILKSWQRQGLREFDFMPNDEAFAIIKPIKEPDFTKQKYNQPNVCVIILESFSQEFIASLNGNEVGQTPFLDSLLKESLTFENSFANGKRSIEAVPAILSSIPMIMNQPLISSDYALNQVNSLPNLLKKKGYETSFFHGASNGSMNFEAYTSHIGIDNYYGKNEYPNKEHFDGNWGIFDEYFLPWSAKKISEFKTPFFTSVFNISSHDPYTIPDHHKNRFTLGPTGLHNSVEYADYSLQLFFEEAKKHAWYNNTLFVIVADHTPPASSDSYRHSINAYSIPIAYHLPFDNSLKGRNTRLTQQIDIMPSVLDLIGYDEQFFAFGNSVFRNNKPFAVNMHSGVFQLYADGKMIQFNGDKVLSCYDIEDKFLENNLLQSENELVKTNIHFLKALLQLYNHSLITNQMSVETVK